MTAIETLLSECETQWNAWKKYGDFSHLDTAHAYVLQLEDKKQLPIELLNKVYYLAREIKCVYRSVSMPARDERRGLKEEF